MVMIWRKQEKKQKGLQRNTEKHLKVWLINNKNTMAEKEKKGVKGIINWLKFQLGIKRWVVEHWYYEENGRVFCVQCGQDINWKKRGDCDVHDMKHWDQKIGE